MCHGSMRENNAWLHYAVLSWSVWGCCHQLVAEPPHLRRLLEYHVWYLNWDSRESWGLVRHLSLSMRISWASHNLVVPGSQISYMAAGFLQHKYFRWTL